MRTYNRIFSTHIKSIAESCCPRFIMGVLPSDDVLQIALTLWSFLGEHMYHTSNKIKLFRMFNIAAMASVIFFIFANLKVVKGALYIKTMESAITVIHVSRNIKII